MTNLLTTNSFVIHAENKKPLMNTDAYKQMRMVIGVVIGRVTRAICVVITERVKSNEAGFGNRQ